MTSTNRLSHLPRRTTLAAGAVVGMLMLAWVGCTFASAHPAAHSPSTATTTTPPALTKKQLLHPAKKYYGISLAGAPSTLTGVKKVTSETGKQPNLLMFFEAWDSTAAAGTPNIDTASILNACKQGLLPMLTWESWNTSLMTKGQGVSWSQPAFAPAKIIKGKYDKYISATALAIKALGAHCPVALRFDQEANGYWYPWGVNTVGMPGNQTSRAAAYIEMWQHVWGIFHNLGVKNVIWTWSPNFQNTKHPKLPDLSATYPGKAYVNWIGIDAYYNLLGQTFTNLFGPTMAQLDTFAPKKPWLVAETGVGSYKQKPEQITNLLSSIANSTQFNGFVYFDQHKASDRNYWPFTNDPNAPGALAAFSKGIASSKFASGKPGSTL